MSVTTRRERREKELRRKQREGRSSGSHGRSGGGGGVNPLLIGAGIVIAVALLIFVGQQLKLFTPPAPGASAVPTPAVSANDPALGTKEKDNGNSHVDAGKPVTYASLPPTSGSHWPAPAAPAPWGIKDTQLPNEVTLHNLEHGGIVIVYNPSLTADDLTKLKDSVRSITATTKYKKILLEPYKELTDAKIVLTAWDWILKLQAPDQSAMVKFISAHYDSTDAPEPGVQ